MAKAVKEGVKEGVAESNYSKTGKPESNSVVKSGNFKFNPSARPYASWLEAL
jgi:hypothetical protein